jgi:hypothetical protein
MDDAIIKFITSYIELSPEEISIIQEQNLIKSYKKTACCYLRVNMLKNASLF